MKTLLLIPLLAALAFAQPSDPGRAPVGKSVTLSASADGTQPFTYQWFKDGVALPGQTADKLVLNPFVESHAGLYHASVTNEAGSTVTNKVQLTPVKAPSRATVTVSIAVGAVNP